MARRHERCCWDLPRSRCRVAAVGCRAAAAGRRRVGRLARRVVRPRRRPAGVARAGGAPHARRHDVRGPAARAAGAAASGAAGLRAASSTRQSDAAGHAHGVRHALRGHRRRRRRRLSRARRRGPHRRAGRPAASGAAGGPELVVLPLEAGYRLAWRVRAFFERSFDVRQLFLDAATGEIAVEWSDSRSRRRRSGPASSATRRSSAFRTARAATRPPTGCGRRSSRPTTSAQRRPADPVPELASIPSPT